MQVTKTYQELLTLEDNGIALYGTPSTEGDLVSFYWDSQPKFRDDICVATPMDFLVASGCDSFCRDAGYIEACGDEEYTLEVAV